MSAPIRWLGFLLIAPFVAVAFYAGGAALGPQWAAFSAASLGYIGTTLLWGWAGRHAERRLNPLPPPEQCATGASGQPAIDAWARVHDRMKTARSVQDAMKGETPNS